MSNVAISPARTHDTGTHEASGLGRHGKGTLLAVEGDQAVFQPLDTNYAHQLDFVGDAGVAGRRVSGAIGVNARKVYSVSSGGNFVQPILGTPRIIQGRVLGLEGNTLYVKAGAVFAVELPSGKDTIDLDAGAIATGSMVNVVALPGAKWIAG